MHKGMIWTFFRHFQTPFSPQKSGFFQRAERGWKSGAFMKEWVKPLCIGYLQPQVLDLPQNLPKTGHLKISWGPTQISYSKFHGLLKFIFHTNQYNGAEQQCIGNQFINSLMVSFPEWSTRQCAQIWSDNLQLPCKHKQLPCKHKQVPCKHKQVGGYMRSCTLQLACVQPLTSTQIRPLRLSSMS